VNRQSHGTHQEDGKQTKTDAFEPPIGAVCTQTGGQCWNVERE
jgi:hypothetical protein